MLSAETLEVLGEIRYRDPETGHKGILGVQQDCEGIVYLAHASGKLVIGKLVDWR